MIQYMASVKLRFALEKERGHILSSFIIAYI